MEVDTEHRANNTDFSQSPSVDVEMMSSSMGTPPDLKTAPSRETSSQPTMDKHMSALASDEGPAYHLATPDAKLEPDT